MNLWGKFIDAQAELRKIYHAIAVLSWDQQTYMPKLGTEARAESLAYLEKLAHSRLISEEFSQLIKDLEAVQDDETRGPIYRAARRNYESSAKIPSDLIEESARANSLAIAAWQEAKLKEDFSLFEKRLEKQFELALKKAEALGYEDEPYDALLGVFEPGMKTKDVDEIFSQLKEALIPLLKEVVANQGDKPNLFNQDFSKQGQWDLGIKALKEMGFDFDCGRQDYSAHPFTIGLDPKDVRITTQINERTFPASLFSSLHEGGHALYEQGIPSEWRHLAVGRAASLAVHESQSRLWENIVGRSKEYLLHLWPTMIELFPKQLQDVEFDLFYQAVNWVNPSLIRVDADEVTYNLHIFVRFELERDVLCGRLKVKDLPDAWNEKIKQYLGLEVPSPSKGLLQDIHWSLGSIGYFPTYALGNIMASQFYAKAELDLPNLQYDIAEGKLITLREWLRENIHKKGSTLIPLELVKDVTGKELSVEPYIIYLKNKYLR